MTMAGRKIISVLKRKPAQKRVIVRFLDFETLFTGTVHQLCNCLLGQREIYHYEEDDDIIKIQVLA